MSNYRLKSSRNCNPKELNLIKDFFEWQGLTLESTRSTGDVLTVTKGRHGCVLFKDDKAVAWGFVDVVKHITNEGLMRCNDDHRSMFDQIINTARLPDPECAQILEDNLEELV